MSSDQHIYVQPPWLKPVNLAVGGAIMALAGIMNVATHQHLSSRIPDWAGMTLLIPIGVWLYAALSALNWSVLPVGSEARATAVKSVKLSAGLMELMNVGEHTWAYIDEHGTFGWDLVPGLLPLLLLGSVPAFLDLSAAHLVGSVLSGHAKVSTPELPAEVSETPAELSEGPEVSETPPAPKVPIEIIEPNLPPVPSEQEEKVPVLPVPKPRPEPSVDLPLDSLSPRRKAIVEDRKWIKEQLAAGVKPETMSAQWCADNNPGRRDPRSWLMHKNYVLKEIASNPAPADNLVALTKEETA